MVKESYGYISSDDSLEDFFFKSEMTKHLYNIVEYPGLIAAMEKERILKSMSNKNYKFQLYIERNFPNTVIGSDVIYVELEFGDQMTRTEYELVK